MTDFAALSTLIGAGLAPSLTFLYHRLERLLHRGGDPEADPQIPSELSGTLTLPLQPDTAELAARTQELEHLRDALSVYYRGIAPIDPADAPLLRTLGRLRGNLEEIYGQRLTFSGEQRPQSGPFVRQRTKHVAGQQIGADAQVIAGATTVEQEVDTVEQGGTNIGMRAGRIGGSPPT